MIKREALSGLLATGLLLTGAPAVFADEWCDIDPLVKVVTPRGSKQYVHATLGAFGREHRQALHKAEIGWYAMPTSDGAGTIVNVTVTVPQDGSGPFPTRALVSTRPHGKGEPLGSTTGTAGAQMTVTYTLQVP